MEKKRKKSILIGITSLFLVMLILVGLTYAYYRTRIIGNDSNDPSISVQSKKLEIVYSDGNATMNMTGKIEPGFVATKEFSIENTGSETVAYSIKLDNITNTFARTEDWTYTLTKNGTEIAKGEMPIQGTHIVNAIDIASETTDNFKLTVTYANLEDVDQSEDMGATLSFRTNITDGITTFRNAGEGTLLAAIGKNSVINDPISDITKSSPVKYDDIVIPRTLQCFTGDENIPYFTYGTGYEYNESTKKFTLTGVTTCNLDNCSGDLVGKYFAGGVDNSNGFVNCTNFATNNQYEIYKIVATEALNDDDIILSGTLKVNKIDSTNLNVTTTEKAFSKTEDDYGTSLYYRGAVKNNFVNYSGKCWRIVRIDGNNNIKLVLDSETKECDASNYVAQPFINNNTDYEFGIIKSDEKGLSRATVDYTLGKIPSALNNWITSKSIDTSKLVSDAEWCNDTSIKKIVYYNQDWTKVNDFDSAYYISYFYGANGRGSVKCKFTGVNNSTPNIVSANIGMLTVDEVMLAGQSGSYLVQNLTSNDGGSGYYWTMTPNSSDPNIMFDPSVESEIYTVSYSGEILNWYSSIGSATVRPTVLLKATTTISKGDGTQSNPYVIN